jgi:hypothetical protein
MNASNIMKLCMIHLCVILLRKLPETIKAHHFITDSILGWDNYHDFPQSLQENAEIEP